MKINDVRLGNWVKCKTNDGVKFGKICDIFDIGYFVARCDGVDYRGKFDGIGVDIECVEPIALTDELLEKCGYKKVNKHAFEKDGFISIHKDSITQVYHLYDSDEDIIIGRGMEGLHHLQNLLYMLVGEELNIEL